MRNPGISIPKPRGLRLESQKGTRVTAGPSFNKARKAPRKMARGINYGKKSRHC